MSGDVQPRKRKDKRRKRDSLDRRSEGDLVFNRNHSLKDDEPKEQHQGVHGSKMGSDDVHLHVQGDHETGGHWCAKIFFFSLLAILLGLVGLIILENRGLSDLDTPLSESRFSNYFDGWVDEHRESHDEHDVVSASIEEHEHGDEPFEEEEDHSEVDEEEEEADEEESEEKDHDEEDEEEEDDEEAATKESEEEDDDATGEVEADAAEDTQEIEENQTEEAEDDDDDDEKTAEETREDVDNDDDDDDTKDNDNDDDTAEEVEPIYTRSQQSSQQATSRQNAAKNDDDDDDEPFEEEDDDGTFESLESVVDNDAEELVLLQEKARKQQEALKEDEPEPEEEATSYSSSLAVKIGVGVALALVARLVLIRKNPNTNEPPVELLKRRVTIASLEDTFVEDQDELLEYEYSGDEKANQTGEEEYIEEEIEEEEEIEVTDEEYEDKRAETKYVPETFEEFHAMYRPQNYGQQQNKEEEEKKVSPIKTKPETQSESIVKPVIQQPSQPKESIPSPHVESRSSPQIFSALSSSPRPSTSRSPIAESKTDVKDTGKYKDEPEEVVEYDDDDMYDEEMLDEEEVEEEDIADDEGDEDDLSDVDDSELMSRLEAKYGRLPPREYDSEEDIDNQSWTKVKSRGGGPQSLSDDAFEEELRKANEEMLRESYKSALTMFESLSRTFPDNPEAFLGQAKALDKLSEIHQSNALLREAIKAYVRYLDFASEVRNDQEYVDAAQRCVDRMRFMGLNLQAVLVQEGLINRFPKDVSFRNQLVVTYLMANRLSDAKQVLEEILSIWPDDGLALVHYGFVLKVFDNNLPLAIEYLQKGIDTGADGTQDGRFYFNLGDSLLRLGREQEARDVYKRGAALKLFPSTYQRSLYNVDGLKAQAIWSKEETGYKVYLDSIESNWQKIRNEGLRLLNSEGLFEDESENLRDTGDWKQFELFARGQKRTQNCLKAPITCALIENFPSAKYCKRGQVKFSVMHPGTHVWPHCGPTNCRLRAHLGLKVPPGTLLRVAEEKLTWQEGRFIIFDDSFEHEVWHNGTTLRLVLIIDIWHPDITEQQRQRLSPI